MLFEVGRPIRIWYPLILWNPHSVLFEVAWCVMLYVTVAGLEFAPVILERLGWEAPKKALKTVMIPLVFFGILLSTMHQSSLGSLFLIVPAKLHPYWYSPLLPLFFIISAMGVGLALLIVASHLSARSFGACIEQSILNDLGKAMAVVMLLYATIRFQDLWARGTFVYLRQPTSETISFLLECLVGVILPIILLLIRRVRENPEGLFAAAVLVITGFLLNRLNVSVTGLESWAGGSYFPRWTEAAVSISTVAAAIFAFALAVRYLNVFAPVNNQPTVRTPLSVVPAPIRSAVVGS
jgi:Ni/Fe-hydrogenase subunit HybB-like protein